MEKRWQIAKSISPEAEKNLEKYPALLRQVLFNRGLADQQSAMDFLAALSPESDPFQMKGMGAAVDRLASAIKHGEAIVVYGDYDADGVSATALLSHSLEAFGANVRAYIPDRFDEGYGLNRAALIELAEQGAKVVVTVDCGIRAIPEAEEALRLGLELIITDHHSIGPELPPATAIINSKLPGDEYPNKNLAGVGTAYLLVCALASELKPSHWTNEHLLDLLTLGTIADLVPLVGENRTLVRKGLGYLRRPHRQGLMSLMGIAGLTPAKISASDVGFMLGPRVNAAGRMGSSMDAYQLLVTQDVFEAGKLAQELDNRNRERQRITLEMAQSAEELAGAEDENKLLISAFHSDYNPGIVGLVASRLSERYHRPAIVGEQGEEFTRASCRSIPEFHITDALQSCAELFENFGGHAAAAGFTIRNDRLNEALERLNGRAQKELGGLELRPTLQADAEVALADLKPDLLHQLELLEPTGYGNPQPQFVSRKLGVRSSRTVGSDASHLKLSVTDGWVTFDAIAFRQGHWANDMPKEIDLLYNFEVNEFNGKRTLQLNVRDIKASAGN
ncbi:MAG: single-stranded-DNA-specific exonuclease RecJ [Chloroflexi bacterium]|nr:single-stranded-DNA-specific exonuclease RecJ [Chloroflexota bacterium]MQC25987.1 single-stranded-DNA-specific exonuclease RecJ [Chloroflexota bacterium]